MAILYVTGFSGILGNLQSPIQAAFGPTESHAVDVNGSSTVSPAVEDGTNLVRLLADTDCNAVIGSEPDALTGNIIPLVANVPEYFGIKPGQQVAVTSRVA